MEAVLTDFHGATLAEFKRFLAEHADRDVLLSTENVTTWMLREDRQDAFLSLLIAARDVVPVRCLWVLRRFDEVIESLFLLMLWHGVAPSLDEHLATRFEEPLFEGMRRVDGLPGIEVDYLRYGPDGSHVPRFLRAVGASADAATVIREGLDALPRLNASVSHAQAAALANLDALADRAGIALDWRSVRQAFLDGFGFAEDRRCELLGGAARRRLHERAFAAARTHGIGAYCEFFDGDDIASREPTRLDPSIVEDGELDRLVAFVRSGRPVS